MTISIDPHILQFGDAIYQVNNITLVETDEKLVKRDLNKEAQSKRVRTRLLWLLIPFVIILLAIVANRESGLVIAGCLSVGLLLLVWAFRQSTEMATEYGIRITTNDANRAIFWTYFEQDRDAILDCIRGAMRDEKFKTYYNEDSREINKTYITNVYIAQSTENYYDYSINSVSNLSLTEEQLRFITNDLSNAFKEVSEILQQKTESEPVLTELRSLLDEFKNDQPTRTQLDNKWAKVKAAAENCGLINDVAGIGSLVAAGIAMIAS